MSNLLLTTGRQSKRANVCKITKKYIGAGNGMYQSRDIVSSGQLIWGPGIPEHLYGDTLFLEGPSLHLLKVLSNEKKKKKKKGGGRGWYHSIGIG